MARVLETAVKLLDRGYRPVILWPPAICRPKLKRVSSGKEGFGYGWGSKEISGETLAADYRAAKAQGGEPGVGICLGPGRAPGGRWLIDVEGDGPEAEASRAKLFGGEVVSTIGWESTRGRHNLFAADGERLRTILAGLSRFQVKKENQPGVYNFVGLPGLELRIGGYTKAGAVKQLQSAAPPTPGTDGVPRAWHDCGVLADLPEAAYEFLISQADDPVRLYLRTALRNAVARIEAAQPGSRRNTYRDEAYCLSGYLHYGIYTEDELFRALTAAKAVGVGDDDPVVIETVADAIAAGKSAPRRLKDELHRAHEANGKATGGKARRTKAQVEPSTNGDGGQDDRPGIEVTTERHEVVRLAILALGPDPDLYHRGGELITVTEETADAVGLTGRTLLRKVLGSPRVVPLSEAVIGCFLTRNARFYRARVVQGEEIREPVHPPDWVIRAVAGHQYWPGVRPLVAVAESPFPRPDGTIVETADYDRETGTLYRPSLPFEGLPGAPTRDDAEAAWARIKAPFDQFPIRTEDDWAVLLAGILNPIARPAVTGPVPGVAVVGNKAGLGKGLIIDCCGIIAAGRPVPTSNYPSDPEEAKKVKVSLALAARAIVHFDNLDEGSTYGASGLDSALTSTTIDDRVLGTSKRTGELPWVACCYLSGNNISPSKDAYRRWLVLNLLTEEERPEERGDLKIDDLREYVAAHRADFVRDALIILKAHALAGRPTGGWAPLGSFEQWDRVVRGAVWFATGRDCCETRRKAADESPDRLKKIALLEGWRELPGGTGGGVTAAEAVKLAAEKPDLYPTLHNALLAYGRDGKLATSGSIGNRIRGMRDNPIEGYKFTEGGTAHRAVRWVVVKVNVKPPPRQNDCQDPRPVGESRESSESNFLQSRGRGKTEDTPTRTHTPHTHTLHENGGKTDSLDSRDSPPPRPGRLDGGREVGTL